MYPCPIQEPPFFALYLVLEGSFNIPGHDAHLIAGAFSLLRLQNSWKDYQTLINLHVPSVEETVPLLGHWAPCYP